MRVLVLLLLLSLSSRAAVECPCDHANPATLEPRQCSLCGEAQKHQTEGTGSFPIFFVKDINPTKPNRTLALPVRHGKGLQDLVHLSPEERTAFWTAAIAKAQELFPNAWGLALNSDTVRTQCHLHVHIGKLTEGQDESTGRTIPSPAQIPIPEPGRGIWLHPVPAGLHIHTDREITEPVLVR